MQNFIDSLTETEISLKSFPDENFPKLKLGNFFRLEKYRKVFLESLRDKNADKFKEVTLAIIKLQSGKDVIKKELNLLLRDVITVLGENVIASDVSFLKIGPKEDKKPEKNSWDFEYRWMAQWIDMLARSYSWELEKILSLSVNFTVYLLQELQVANQFEKEWQYSITELAYQYEEGSKKSKYVPLNRPHWMQAGTANIKKSKIRRDMLPYGVITDLSGMGVFSNEINQQDVTKMD